MLRLVNPKRYMAALEERFASRAEARARHKLKHDEQLQARHELLMQQKNSVVELPTPQKFNLLTRWKKSINFDVSEEPSKPALSKPDMTKPYWWRKHCKKLSGPNNGL